MFNKFLLINIKYGFINAARVINGYLFYSLIDGASDFGQLPI